MKPSPAYKFVVTALLLGTTLLLSTALPAQQNSRDKQYAFKAAFLFRFMEYIDWPNGAKSATFSFAVLGKSPLTNQMITIANEQKVKNTKMAVREYASLDEIGNCQILFVPENCPIPIETILAKYAGKPVLVVTEREGLAERGAHINFILSDTKLKFEFNLKAIDDGGIKVSSNLLKHAIIVD